MALKNICEHSKEIVSKDTGCLLVFQKIIFVSFIIIIWKAKTKICFPVKCFFFVTPVYYERAAVSHETALLHFSLKKSPGN